MRRLEFLNLVRPMENAPLFLLFFFLSFAGMYPATSFSNLMSLPRNSASAAESPNDSVDGTWRFSLPMPGGTKECTLVLSTDGDSISGSMSNPAAPKDVREIYGGTFQDGNFRLSTDIGRITYFLNGTREGSKLSFDLTTTETITLGDGRRLGGKTGDITGKYLVPIDLPGGITEYYFDLQAVNGMITGKMYVPGTVREMSKNKVDASSPETNAPPDGSPAGAQTDAGYGDLGNYNTFYASRYEGNRVDLFTRTSPGSLFHFTGIIVGNVVKLVMQVTDEREGLEALRVK